MTHPVERPSKSSEKEPALSWIKQSIKNITNISAPHLYNIRSSSAHQKQHRFFEKTKSRQILIGERRKPNSKGKPGYLRVDTVHQGDQDGVKGVYHISAVNEVTPYEIILSCGRISEQFLIPFLTEMLESFSFGIKGFHADNGSEYINQQAFKLLNKLHIELTKLAQGMVMAIH